MERVANLLYGYAAWHDSSVSYVAVLLVAEYKVTNAKPANSGGQWSGGENRLFIYP